MQNGSDYIQNQTAELTTDGGMPATFATNFDAAKDTFELKHQAFLQAAEMGDIEVTAGQYLSVEQVCCLLQRLKQTGL